jgi:hypothetical protein
MPIITFLWYPRSDGFRVGPIVDELQSIAELQNISFYVNAKEEEEHERVVLGKDVTIPRDVEDQLRRLADRADVTIYVNPA